MLPWQQHSRCHSGSFVIYISGAKFKEHCFSEYFWRYFFICIILKREYRNKIFQKEKPHSTLLLKAFQMSSDYFLLHRHLNALCHEAMDELSRRTQKKVNSRRGKSLKLAEIQKHKRSTKGRRSRNTGIFFLVTPTVLTLGSQLWTLDKKRHFLHMNLFNSVTGIPLRIFTLNFGLKCLNNWTRSGAFFIVTSRTRITS